MWQLLEWKVDNALISFFMVQISVEHSRIKTCPRYLLFTVLKVNYHHLEEVMGENWYQIVH